MKDMLNVTPVRISSDFVACSCYFPAIEKLIEIICCLEKFNISHLSI